MNFKVLFTRIAATVPGEIVLGDEQLFYVAIGAVLAFAAIGLLWAVLSVFKKVFGGSSQSQSTDDATVGVTAGNTAPAAVPAQNADAQLIAVLTAAVAAYMADENGTPADPSTFRVVSFKRVSPGRAWNSK